jgi:hypothetical protein
MPDHIKQFLMAHWNLIFVILSLFSLYLSRNIVDQTLEALSRKPLHLFLFVLRIAIASAAFVIAASTPTLAIAMPAAALGFVLILTSPQRGDRRP